MADQSKSRPPPRLSLVGALDNGSVDLETRPGFLDALGVALYTTDRHGGLTYFNDAAATLWGRRPELGEPWCGSWRLFWPDGRPMAHGECQMAIALKERRAVRGSVAMAERLDGSRVWFEAYPSPLFDAEGRLAGGVSLLVDITERRQAEEALKVTTQALAVSSAARDDFLGLVSHELRTPVTTIYGNARLLLARVDGLAVQEREMIKDVAIDSARLLDIVENLLQLSRLQADARPELEPELLDHVLRREAVSFRRRHPSRQITVDAPDGNVVVEADRAYLTMVIENLLSNADKYGGDKPIQIKVEERDGEAAVTVSDRGVGIVGISEDDLFAPFFRAGIAKASASGLGLGLAVCRQLIEAMGGRMWARARHGGGSEFGFSLALSADTSLEEGRP